jgi:cyclopropane fatty-acyl-phospholipid synthase-like methyltransferase
MVMRFRPGIGIRQALFEARWKSLQAKYDQPFYRMWKLYLQGCAGAFRIERMRVWQCVFSKGGVVGGYRGRYLKTIQGIDGQI